MWKTLHRFAPPELVVALRYRQTALSKRPQAFPPKNMVVVSRVSAGSVLVLAPHPDDEVIGPGGAISQHLQNKDSITILYLTDGRGANESDTSLVKVRQKEAKTIGATYGLEQIFWDIPDTTLKNDPVTVKALETVLVDLRPDFIYLPSFFDRQFDHFAANKILADALRYLDNPAATILGYEVWDNISFPNYIVDISNNFDTKAAMMAMYKTPMQVTDFISLFRHRNALYYSLFVNSKIRRPEGHAEAFYRLDSSHFVTLFDTYSKTLKGHNSPIPTTP